MLNFIMSVVFVMVTMGIADMPEKCTTELHEYTRPKWGPDTRKRNLTKVNTSSASLFDRLLCGKNYTRDILPVKYTNETVFINLLLMLIQINDIDEKSQIMTTNVWLHHEWYDNTLSWDPAEYGGLTSVYIPAHHLWLPDTVLYNNADGDYNVTMDTKVKIYSSGLVIWEPPAMYKSFCAINVEFFPYDFQQCEMKVYGSVYKQSSFSIFDLLQFGPWTYDISKVDYVPLPTSRGNHDRNVSSDADLSFFIESIEWDITDATATRTQFQYDCCKEFYVDITYKFGLRRKTLFYTLNIMLPCFLIAFATIIVFILPPTSAQKIALSASTFLALTWFILLLSQIIPPTSFALPLMGKFLLFTMGLVSLSIIGTVIVLHNNYRYPYVKAMPYWVHYMFLEILPALLLFQSTLALHYKFQKDKIKECEDCDVSCGEDDGKSDQYIISTNSSSSTSGSSEKKDDSSSTSSPNRHRALQTGHVKFLLPKKGISRKKANPTARRPSMQFRKALMLLWEDKVLDGALYLINEYMAFPEVQKAAKSIQFISKFYRRVGKVKLQDDWETVALVLDRLCLILLSAAAAFGTITLVMRAPSFYDSRPALHCNQQVCD